MTRPRRREPFGARIFRALLALYPASFRDEYGRELALVFRDRYRDAAGPLDRARLWLEALAGVLVEAPREHARTAAYDLRYAWRTLRGQALLTATIVVVLGLGIGVNTAVFSALNAVVLASPSGVPQPDRLYSVNGGGYESRGRESARLSGPMFDALRQAAPGGVGVAAMSRAIARAYTRIPGERETTPAALHLVSPDFFEVLGAAPALGRTFSGIDGLPDHEPVAVLSHAYWRERFGGAPDVIGRSIAINGTAFTIVGVGPRDFTGVWLETPVEVWVPLTMQAAVKYSQSYTADGADLGRPWLPQANIWWLHVVVSIPPEQEGATRGAFDASLSNLAGREAGIVLEPLARGFSQVRQRLSTPLLVVLVMAALVLLIACANAANALLARAVGRQREIAVRMAIGAGRMRLLHQFLTESALLVAIAAAAAILSARWAGDVLLRLATATLDGPPPLAAPVDLRVLAFAAAAALLSVAILGVWPAWRATRVDVVSALKAGASSAMSGAARPARGLVVLQVALSLVLVAGTGLFARSFRNLVEADLGFEPGRLLTVTVDPRLSGVTEAQLPALSSRLLDAVAEARGVESASLAMCGLEGVCAREDGYAVEGYRPREGDTVRFAINAISPDYFPTVGMRLVAGRGLTASDRGDTAAVAVVNRTLAETYFGNVRHAIGRHFGFGEPDIEIVGVVDDVRGLGNVRASAMPTVYRPLAQRAAVPRELQVRTTGDPSSAVAFVRRAIAGAAPELPVERIERGPERVRRSMGQDRAVVLLTSAFSVLAIALAGFGLFGVLSYAVARRTPELGLRLALGAGRGRVVSRVAGDALRLVGSGVLLGLPLRAHRREPRERAGVRRRYR